MVPRKINCRRFNRRSYSSEASPQTQDEED